MSSENKCPICLKSCPQYFIEHKWEYNIYECSNCTVQHSIPLESNPDDRRIKMGYRRRLELIGNYIGWAQRDFLGKNIKPGGKLLEIGCGTGDFVVLANRKGYKAVGVDLDKEAILSGKNYWKTDSIFPMSAAEYFSQNKRKKFDIIYFFEVLEHQSSPHLFLEEVKKYLKFNGYISFSTPNNSLLQKIYRKITAVIDYPPQHLLRWNEKSIRIFLGLYGFEIVYRKTCEPSLTDIIPDLFKLYTPSFIPTPILVRLSWIVVKILSPIDKIAKIFAKEGRSQLIIAKLKE